MSMYGGRFDGRKDDVYYAMRAWVFEKTGCESRVEVLKHLAECLAEVADTAAFYDAEDQRNAIESKEGQSDG